MVKRKAKNPAADFMALSDAQKKRIWESFNRDLPPSETRPMTSREIAQQQPIIDRLRKRLRGRPKIGAGSQRVQLSIERGLLREADAYAQAKGLTRAQLVAKGLRAVIR